MIQLLEIGLIALLLFFLQQVLYKRLWNRSLKADITFCTSGIFEGEQGSLLEVIENHKRLPLSMLKVKFQTSRNLIFELDRGSRATDQYYRNDIFHVGGGEKITRTILFTGGKRGFYHIHNIDLVASDLFLTLDLMESVPLDRTIYVYPKPFDSREFRVLLQQLNGELLVRRYLLEDPFEYRGIREYQPYDNMRSINWKATAKTGELKVTQKNPTSLPSVRIFFNVEDNGILRKEECVEDCFRIVAGLCRFLVSQGVCLSCYGNGVDISTGEPVFLEGGSGRGMLEQIYRTLARVDTSRPTADFGQRFGELLLGQGKDTFTCIIAPNHYAPFAELIETFQESGGDYLWLYPVSGKTEPEVPEALAEHIRFLHVRD